MELTCESRPRDPFQRLGLGAWFAAFIFVACCMAPNGAPAQQGSGESQSVEKSPQRSAVPAPPDVAAPSPGSQKTASGVAMKILTPGDGTEHPVENDCIRARFTAWKRDGSLFSTSGLHEETVVQCLNTMVPGVAEAFKKMVAGGKRRVWVPANLTFVKKHRHGGGFDRMAMDEEPSPNVDLTFDIELVQIIKAPTTPADLSAPPKSAVRTPSGLAFRILKSADGTQHPSMTSQVTLHFSGWTRDGTLFESTVMGGHPAIFLVGNTLPGWQEGLAHMVVGEKMRLWVPAALAYGDKPVNNMSPAGDLVYDIELLGMQ